MSVLSRKSTTGIKPNLYTCKFELDTPKVTPQSRVKCSCSCADFRYRQAKAFYDKDALLVNEDYLLKMSGVEIKADKTNPTGIIKACKHIKAALSYAIQRKI